MKIKLTKDLSDALLKQPNEIVKKFIEAIDRIKDLNKTEILALDKTVVLTRVDNVDVYAYNLGGSMYVLFAFLPQKTMLLLDVIELVDGKELKFLALKKPSSDDQHV